MRRVTVTDAEFTGAKMPGVDLYYARAEAAINGKRCAPPEFGNCNLRDAIFVARTLPEGNWSAYAGSQGRPSASMRRVSKKFLPCLAAVDR